MKQPSQTKPIFDQSTNFKLQNSKNLGEKLIFRLPYLELTSRISKIFVYINGLYKLCAVLVRYIFNISKDVSVLLCSIGEDMEYYRGTLPLFFMSLANTEPR